MIIAPYNTDAPIYHLPIATVGMIVVNVVVFFATTFQVMIGNLDEEAVLWLILEFDTINPLQWVTSAFMHGGIMHLLGNMIFLWSFGLVVEGKVGTWRFLLLYLLITLIDGALVQIPMFCLGSDSGALGASGVIFALMMIAVVWAPENEMDCFYWFFYVVGSFEIRIVSLGGIYIFLQILFLWLGGFAMSSEMLHLIGVMIGAPIGFLMLRQDMVDCEGWDLVSRNEFLQEYDLLCTEEQRQRIKKRQQAIEDPVTAALGYTQPIPVKTSPQPYRAAADEDESLPEPTQKKKKKRFGGLKEIFEPERNKRRQQGKVATSAQDSASSHPDFNRLAFAFRQALDAQGVSAAHQTFQRMDQLKIAIGLGDKSLLRYVGLLGKEKRWVEAMRPLSLVVDHDGERADDARLRVAQIQLNVMHQPDVALRTLGQVSDRPRAGQEESHAKRMAAKAKLSDRARREIG